MVASASTWEVEHCEYHKHFFGPHVAVPNNAIRLDSIKARRHSRQTSASRRPHCKSCSGKIDRSCLTLEQLHETIDASELCTGAAAPPPSAVLEPLIPPPPPPSCATLFHGVPVACAVPMPPSASAHVGYALPMPPSHVARVNYAVPMPPSASAHASLPASDGGASPSPSASASASQGLPSSSGGETAASLIVVRATLDEGRAAQEEAEGRCVEERTAREEAEGRCVEERTARKEAEGRCVEERTAREEAERRLTEERTAREEAERRLTEERTAREEAERRLTEERAARANLEEQLTEKKKVVTRLTAGLEQLRRVPLPSATKSGSASASAPTSATTQPPPPPSASCSGSASASAHTPATRQPPPPRRPGASVVGGSKCPAAAAAPAPALKSPRVAAAQKRAAAAVTVPQPKSPRLADQPAATAVAQPGGGAGGGAGGAAAGAAPFAAPVATPMGRRDYFQALLDEWSEISPHPDLATFMAGQIRAADPAIMNSSNLNLKQLGEPLLEEMVQSGSYAVGPDERTSGRLGALAKAFGGKLDNVFKDLNLRAAIPADAPVCDYCQDEPGTLTCLQPRCTGRPHHSCFTKYWLERGQSDLADVAQPGYCMHHASMRIDA